MNAPAQNFGNPMWNGSCWVGVPPAISGMRVVKQLFSTPGSTVPYQPSPGLVTAVIECYGAGGGGGPVSMATATIGAAGGGGGSGGYSMKVLPASIVLGGVLVTIGAGGQGILSTIQPALGWQLAQSGGLTQFGAFCLANGGWGGQLHNGTTAIGQSGDGAPELPSPGYPGIPSAIGDLAVGGNCGANGQVFTVSGDVWALGGFGGSMLMGGSGRALSTGPGAIFPGPDETLRYGPGAGGGGAYGSMVIGQANGGAGQPGLCVVTEYCWAGAGGGEGCAPGARVGLDWCG